MEKVQKAIEKELFQYSNNGQIILNGRIFSDEIVLSLGFLAKNSIRQVNFVVSADIEPSPEEENPPFLLTIEKGLHFLQLCLLDYFERKEELVEDFPKVWHKVQFNDETLFVRIDPTNSELESEANKILGLKEDTLYNDSDEDDDGKKSTHH